jgi:hypothetical protein
MFKSELACKKLFIREMVLAGLLPKAVTRKNTKSIILNLLVFFASIRFSDCLQKPFRALGGQPRFSG